VALGLILGGAVVQRCDPMHHRGRAALQGRVGVVGGALAPVFFEVESLGKMSLTNHLS
jgi:hypothetical protein